MRARTNGSLNVGGGLSSPRGASRGLALGRRIFAPTMLLLLLGACTQQSAEPAPASPPEADAAAATPAATPVQAAPAPLSWTHFDPPAPPEVTPALQAKGAALYEQNCASCHGDTGAADGVCAPFLAPQPRDFTKSVFRFKTTEAGELPSDTDLFRTISLGLHATGMPPWEFLLSEEDRWALVAHVKTLAPDFAEEEPGEPVDMGTEPAEVTPEDVERGRQLFLKGCTQCHGERGYGDGPSARAGLKDIYGNPISPRNFHKAPTFKRGHTLRDIALTIHTGNDGTPMPAFSEVFSQEDIWAMAGYVQSLADKHLAGTGTPAAATKGDELGTPDVVIELTERKWVFHPNRLEVRQGQVVRINFQPTDNGLGVGHGFAVDGYDKSTFINGAMVQRPKSVTFVANKAGTFTFYCATQCSTGSLHPKMNGTFIVTPAAL